jgi:hypothetical protein
MAPWIAFTRIGRRRELASDHDRAVKNRISRNQNATEEERLGLVKGDSSAMLPLPDYTSDDDDWQIEEDNKT